MKWKTHMLNGLVVLNFAGNPTVELKDGNLRPTLHENLKIKSDTYIHTHENEYVVVKINDLYKVTVLPDSIFTIEGVKQKDEFDIRSVYIRSGQVHILELPKVYKERRFFKNSGDASTAEEPAYDPMKIDSDFFSILTEENQKLSLIVDVNLKKALLDVCNLGKDFKLDLFNHEVSQVLKASEGVKFQGVLDSEGKIAYDLLLQKRKIPQGKWLEKKPCDELQVKKIQNDVEKNQVSEAQKNQKSLDKKMAQKRKDDAHYLCHNPYGQLNQCHFILKQNKCWRARCNAEGKWAESAEVGVSKNQCSKSGEVRACGY